MDSVTTIVFLMLGSDHLANVRTLQSIYKQTCDDVALIAINDCCEDFQSERFFYNLEDKAHLGVRRIIFTENWYPHGEIQSKREHLKKIAGDYLITLRAGDTFTHIDALKKVVSLLNENGEMDAVAAGVSAESQRQAMEKSIDGCNVLYRVCAWTKYDRCAGQMDEKDMLWAMIDEKRVLFLDEAICRAARLDCFKHPNFEQVDLTSAHFCKMKEELKEEYRLPCRERREAVLYRVTHIRMIALYGAIWLTLSLLFVLLFFLHVHGPILYAVGALGLLSGVFALGMMALKILRRLRREGIL